MSDEQNPADVLARARRAWSPTAADAERVRRAVAAAVSGTPAAGGVQPPRHAAAAPWTARFLLASALAATSGGIGYWAGHRAALREARATAPVALVPPQTGAVAEAQRPPSPTAAPAPTVAGPSLVPSHHDARLVRHAAETGTRATTESLAAEVQGLRNAERALRDGNPGLALAFLAELDRQVPEGQLTEERDAAATLARCARGDHPFGVDLSEEFEQRHPASVYRARVAQACRTTDSAPPGDSSLRRPNK